MDLEHFFCSHARVLERLVRAARRDDAVAETHEHLCNRHNVGLVLVCHRDEYLARLRQAQARRDRGLGVRAREGRVDAHDLAGRTHLGAEERVAAGELVERDDDLLDRHVVGRQRLLGEADLGQRLARHDERRILRDWVADRLGHKRHGARRARVGLNDVRDVVLHRKLDVDEPHDAELRRNHLGPLADLHADLGADGLCGDAARRVARVDAGLLNVLHHAGNHAVAVLVAQRVHVQLHRAVEVLVDEHWLVLVHLDGKRDVPLEVGLVVHNLHRAATEHVRRADHHREAKLFRRLKRLRLRAAAAAGRLADVELGQHLEPAVAVLGAVNRVGRRAPDLAVAVAAGSRDRQRLQDLVQLLGDLQRRLAAKRHDHSFRALDVDDVQHVLESDWLKVEA
mmetsp:Transcript_14341/g.41815  ORF Transcript_14341/g.41815 Transcript_14341/m.41815 type:complete len:397 (-) Transcript_14341:2015-3205(-)